MQQIRGLIPSENNAYASSRTIKNLVSFLFSFVCYNFIQRTRKIVFIFCLLERYKKNVNKCKKIKGDYMMLNDFVPLKAILSIHYHRCFPYNWKNEEQRKKLLHALFITNDTKINHFHNMPWQRRISCI